MGHLFYSIACQPVKVYIGTMLVLALVCLRAIRSRRAGCASRPLSVSALLILPGVIVTNQANLLMDRLRPYKLDPFIFQIDRRLFHTEPAFAAGQWLASLPEGLRFLPVLVYALMPTMLVLVFWLYALRYSNELREVAWAIVLDLVLSLPLYALVPVAGPRYAFPSFPISPSRVAQQPLLLHALPNGVPSIHFSSALLVAWYARRWWWGRVGSFLYVALTVLATLGSGEHYLFDLLAALPYTFGVIRVAGVFRSQDAYLPVSSGTTRASASIPRSLILNP